ncbi:MAG TPA: metallophosphoesterase, partial [Candidatus Wallbacteria bacterium]|nr:metallophosphoesterase [Candidatus Wallbacteria bacterium]
MKWIIGDIHGMFDPLKKLITYLTALEKRPDTGSADYRIEKLIFVGDYIDRGPSAKEVVDYLISLKHEKIFLCGNHEDMMINFINNGRELQEYGNNWFRGNNGGWQT